MCDTKENSLITRSLIDGAVNNLSVGLTSVYEPALMSMRTQLLEITKKQEFLNNELHQENLKLSEAVCSDEFRKMFIKIKIYREKLSLIKRDMVLIHEQSTKLKKRALKLEQQKQREALEKVHKREYEELLISKSSTV